MTQLRAAACLACIAVFASWACTPGKESGEGTSTQTPDGGAEKPAPITPSSVEVDGDPNGLFWSASDGTLYVADDEGNRLLSFKDGAFAELAQLPKAPSNGPGLGQVVRRADGTFIVPRFGYGTSGDVVVVEADHTSRALSKLDPQRRRIGATEGPDGRLFVGYFAGEKNGRVGAIAELDVAAQKETVVASDFKKPVGILADRGGLLVADQDTSEVLRVPFSNPTARTVVARIASPDLMTWGEDGSFYVGSKEGYVSHVLADGTIIRVPGSLREVRGVAIDPEGRRLFAVDHDTKSDDARNYIQILPLDE